MSSISPTVGPYAVEQYKEGTRTLYRVIGPGVFQSGFWSVISVKAEAERMNAAYLAGQASREQSAQPQQPVAMIHNDYDASVACSNCGTDGGFSTYDDLDWARCCPGCGRPISEQVDAKGNRTPHPLYVTHLPTNP